LFKLFYYQIFFKPFYAFRNTFVSPEDVVAQTVSGPIFSLVCQLFSFLNDLCFSLWSYIFSNNVDLTYISNNVSCSDCRSEK